MPTTFLCQPFIEDAKRILLQPPPCPPEFLRLQVAGTSCSLHAQELADTIYAHFDDIFQHKFLSPPQPQPADMAIHFIGSAGLTEKYEHSILALFEQLTPLYEKAAEQKQLAPQPSAQHSLMLHVEESSDGLWVLHTRFAALVPQFGPARLISPLPKSARAVVQTFWKFLLHRQLLASGGALLHASGLVRDGQAHLFAGTSGSGKTTATRNAPPNTQILSDEIVALRPNPQNPRNLYAYGTPFYGDWGAPGEEIAAPLAGIHFLKRATSPAKHPLSPRESFQRLARVICFSFPNQREQLLLMELLDQWLPFCDLLETPPTNAYWELLAHPTTPHPTLSNAAMSA
ncbi:hypothetical protein L6R29_09650 [Myxococcota bacterium]|nr:hypothetical protein [Myxococcota bacterium]